ncbi:MAG: twin-arginine translocase subunit TatC [Anaerolineae bacterium]|nr:twin-arginine translocase subunit TatC [Anaerolineae bacterium]
MNDPTEEKQQAILEHLNDLRIRVTWIVVSVVVCTIVSFIFAERILLLLSTRSPIALTSIKPTETIQSYFKVSLMAGGILAMPMILFQIWLFISPGLEKREKRAVYVFVPAAMLLFLSGVAFTWYVLLPAALYFLANFLADVVIAEWTVQEYIGFVTGFLFWVGVTFEMPLIFYFAGRAGFMEASTLRQNWRIAVVGIAVAAAIITPSVDPVTMLLTMVPMLFLYVLSISLTGIGYRQFIKSGTEVEKT